MAAEIVVSSPFHNSVKSDPISLGHIPLALSRQALPIGGVSVRIGPVVQKLATCKLGVLAQIDRHNGTTVQVVFDLSLVRALQQPLTCTFPFFS